jgi:hypothetical protein
MAVQFLPSSAAIFHFPVLYDVSKSNDDSLLQTPSCLTASCDILCAYLAAILHEEEQNMVYRFNPIISR